VRWLAALILFWMPLVTAWAEGSVYLVLSERDGAYEEAARAFQDAVGKVRNLQVLSVREMTQEQVRGITQSDNLLVPVGMKAVQFVAENHAGRGSVLGLMVPRASAEKVRWPNEFSPGRLAFVYIDQPVERSLALLAALMPDKTRVGTLISSSNGELLNTLDREAQRHGFTLVPAVVDEPNNVGPALRQVLLDSEVFLLLPDSVVLSGTNLQSLLMASYRLRVPVLGFSPGIVKSGAVAAVFSTPGQIGTQGGIMARRWTGSASLPGSQYASQYSLDINNHVARSLGLSLPPEQSLVKTLGAKD